MEQIIYSIIVVISVLLILVVIIQPSQRTGLIGDATDSEKREKRGFELFLYRLTVVLMVMFIGFGLLYGAINAGLL